MFSGRKILNLLVLGVLVISILASCSRSEKTAKANSSNKKVGVLLVNHGSRSEAWRNGLLDLEKRVRDSIMADGVVKDVKTAFMEYTEPSIATRLKEFDKENYSDVILVPVFLTVSSHSFDDIPTLIGQKDDPKSIELFKIEKWNATSLQPKYM
jgi:cobalamin biosynthesis Co2+ chelatase CbiK